MIFFREFNAVDFLRNAVIAAALLFALSVSALAQSTEDNVSEAAESAAESTPAAAETEAALRARIDELEAENAAIERVNAKLSAQSQSAVDQIIRLEKKVEDLEAAAAAPEAVTQRRSMTITLSEMPTSGNSSSNAVL